MDTTMAISGETIKSLREAKAWSQAHLAEAAGLSLRTVQRVEAEGTASPETRLAIAGALGVPVDALNAVAVAPVAPVAAPAPVVEPDYPVESTSGIPWVYACSALVMVYVLWLAPALPPRLASHFGAAGNPDGYMSRDAFVAVMCLMAVLLPMLILKGLALAVRHNKVNLPNARFWLAPARRAATERWLHRHVTWMCMGMTLFMGYAAWMVAVANRTTPPSLDMHLALVGLAVMLAGTTAWIVVFTRRFSRDGS